MGIRDSQRGKLYRAEGAIYSRGERFEGLAATTAYVRHVFTDARLTTRYPELNALASRLDGESFQVRDGRGCRNARGSAFRLTLPLWARNEPVILHEIAHAIMGQRFIANGAIVAAHGWQFAQVFLDLVRTRMGVAAYLALRASFKANRVRYNAPREYTPEQRAAMAARLLELRQRRELALAAKTDTVL